jgi:hypothetical protein
MRVPRAELALSYRCHGVLLATLHFFSQLPADGSPTTNRIVLQCS